MATLKKTVNKFKKGDKDRRGGKSSDKSSDSSTKGSDVSKKKKKKEKEAQKELALGARHISPSQQTQTSPLIIDGVKYWWCLALNKWVKHAPHECTAKDKKTSNTSGKTSGARNGATVEATMALHRGCAGVTSAPGYFAMPGHH